MLWTLRNKRYTNKLLLVLLCENSFRLTLENAGSYSLVFAVLTSEARVRYARGGGGMGVDPSLLPVVPFAEMS